MLMCTLFEGGKGLKKLMFCTFVKTLRFLDVPNRVRLSHPGHRHCRLIFLSYIASCSPDDPDSFIIFTVYFTTLSGLNFRPIAYFHQ